MAGHDAKVVHSNDINRKVVSKIGIIGAGVSGLAAAKQLAHHNPVVFESSASIGGVWRSCSYHSTKLQSPRCAYEFSDFSWPKRDNPEFPTYLEILEYLESYVNHFDLRKFIKLNSKVMEVRFISGKNSELLGKPIWEVAVKTKDTDGFHWHAFEFLVVCTGKYGDVSKIPTFPSQKGPEIFKGKVLHSIDYSKLNAEEASELVRGKRVAIIGFKKSAIDLAAECAAANQEPGGQACTMVIRSPHWIVPHYRVWGLPFFLFYSTRSSQLLHEKPNQNFFRALLVLLLSPMRRLVSKFIESYLRWKLPLDRYNLKPDHPFEEDYASCQMAIMPEGFFEEAEKGNIRFRRAANWWFFEDGLEFEDGAKLEADVVIFATGYDGKKKLDAVIPEPFRSFLNCSGVIPLYRGTIHPLIPSMAFVGYIESVANLHTSELRSMWLARLVDGHFELPSVERMQKQISSELEVMRRSTRFYRRQCISTFSIHHSDEICRDMGMTPWRKKNWLHEAFIPYMSEDYRQWD